MRPGSPEGTTRVAAVIGHPVRHSLSPVLFNAAFLAADLDWTYVALEVRDGDGEAAVSAVRTLGLAGLNVTMPHKQAAARACDHLTPLASSLGAVNCVWLDDGDLVGDSTDGPGLVSSLEAAGHPAPGRRCAVVGAGGAARAIVASLAGAGASEVLVVARRPEAATAAAALAGPVGRPGGAAELGACDIVCNATSVGMAGAGAAGEVPFDPSVLHEGQVVVDIVYHPLDTPLLAAARSAGAHTVDGLGMLVHQAAAAFLRWTGHPAPVDAMAEAARLALSGRRRGR